MTPLTRRALLATATSAAMASTAAAFVLVDVASGRMLRSQRLEVAERRFARPGSILKPFVLLSLLESRAIRTSERFLCEGTQLRVAGRNLTCTHPLTGTPLDPSQALAYSCNSWFASATLRIRPSTLTKTFRRYGFDAVDVAPETESRQLQALGLAGTRTSATILAAAYRQLALLRLRSDRPDLQPLFSGMANAAAYGTAQLAQLPGAVRVAGKTGSAPADEGPWLHAWFAGFAPESKPEVAIAVYVEKGTGGSDAAPVASEVLHQWFAGR